MAILSIGKLIVKQKKNLFCDCRLLWVKLTMQGFTYINLLICVYSCSYTDINQTQTYTTQTHAHTHTPYSNYYTHMHATHTHLQSLTTHTCTKYTQDTHKTHTHNTHTLVHTKQMCTHCMHSGITMKYVAKTKLVYAINVT